jgi:hypothetical protein
MKVNNFNQGVETLVLNIKGRNYFLSFVYVCFLLNPYSFRNDDTDRMSHKRKL